MLHKRLCGPQRQSRSFGDEKKSLSPAWIKPQLLSCPARSSTPGLLLNKERHKFCQHSNVCIQRQLEAFHRMLTQNFPNEKVTMWQCLRNQELLSLSNLLSWIKRFIHVQKEPIIWFQPKPDKFSTHSHNGPGKQSRYSNSLRARRSWVQNPVGLRFSAHIQTSPGAHPASYTMGTGLSRG